MKLTVYPKRRIDEANRIHFIHNGFYYCQIETHILICDDLTWWATTEFGIRVL